MEHFTQCDSLLGSLLETPGQMLSLKTFFFLFRSLSNEINALEQAVIFNYIRRCDPTRE